MFKKFLLIIFLQIYWVIFLDASSQQSKVIPLTLPKVVTPPKTSGESKIPLFLPPAPVQPAKKIVKPDSNWTLGQRFKNWREKKKLAEENNAKLIGKIDNLQKDMGLSLDTKKKLKDKDRGKAILTWVSLKDNEIGASKKIADLNSEISIAIAKKNLKRFDDLSKKLMKAREENAKLSVQKLKMGYLEELRKVAENPKKAKNKELLDIVKEPNKLEEYLSESNVSKNNLSTQEKSAMNPIQAAKESQRILLEQEKQQLARKRAKIEKAIAELKVQKNIQENKLVE